MPQIGRCAESDSDVIEAQAAGISGVVELFLTIEVKCKDRAIETSMIIARAFPTSASGK
jgi:hypothetical protein